MIRSKLSLSSYLFVGSMLFGLFFGAGNLIFPVHMGQEAGTNILPTIIGFLLTGVGLPFLGLLALGVSGSANLYELAGRIHPFYALLLTVALNLTIGPVFALPRTGSVSYEIGLAPYIAANHQAIALFIFTLLFFSAALILSLRPSKILLWVGKILNPLFLIFLAILIIIAFCNPMGNGAIPPAQAGFASAPFFRGFTEGYNTMDALASLVFGVIVIDTLHGLGLSQPKEIAVGALKAGIITLILMSILYSCLSYIGVFSANQFPVSDNGGIALAQIADYYLGTAGDILLAVIVTLACLKTAIGLITACSDIFCTMFPDSVSYRKYVFIFTIISFIISNIGLTEIINLAVPVLMFLYPLCITLILLSLLSPLFGHRQSVYVCTTIFTVFAAFGDVLNSAPAVVKNIDVIQSVIHFYYSFLPFFDIGMGWAVPAAAGFVLGCLSVIYSFIRK
ncbi:branched-chain amino acid transport system II carrier protein [Pectinatus haikarae]|uniref:Branched-chain amino acid transport system carrier protein n=1 Tax=Pectinatus haikarae TaxID=349096 RepID=A0ABT9Y9D7_9FIRM|nr:branched-chain amino acid transport system II carrier protein [Pectinatus haikarae]MDQ0204253.1 LIVCS family branched-chain amino acid:cation transporter [Pectinatus haikarae]